MYFCIYKITNLINGKFYIGAHKTKNLNDDYFGSGVGIKRAVKKHGKKFFVKEIIEFLPSEEEMYRKEKELVVLGEESYNMTLGGKGGFSHIRMDGDNNIMRKSPETREKISKIIKEQRNDPIKKDYYDNISRKNLEKAVASNKGRKRPDHSKFMSEWSKSMWNEKKDLIRDKLSSTYEVTSPIGEIYVTNRLREFCKEHNLSFTTIWGISVSNKMPSKGKCKGWNCKRI